MRASEGVGRRYLEAMYLPGFGPSVTPQMSEELKALASQLTHDLDLAQPPIQISYLEHAPHGVPEHPGGSPSVCTFFSEGRKGAFYVPMKGHEACEIGAFVLGIAPEGELGTRLMATIGMMQKEGYLAPGDEGKIPKNAKAPNFVAYGPLGSLPMAPTNILLFAKPKSAMLAMEASQQAVPVNGRPMCAVVPTLNNGAPVAVSIGCIGSRVYTQMGDDQMIVGVRGDFLKEFARRLKIITHANQVVKTEDESRKAPYHPRG
jgi:uncharacterized protein (DUF169 family)